MIKARISACYCTMTEIKNSKIPKSENFTLTPKISSTLLH